MPWANLLPVLLQLDGVPLQVGDPLLLVGDGVVPVLDLALQVADVLLQVPDGRVQLLVHGRHLANAGPVLVGVFDLENTENALDLDSNKVN